MELGIANLTIRRTWELRPLAEFVLELYFTLISHVRVFEIKLFYFSFISCCSVLQACSVGDEYYWPCRNTPILHWTVHSGKQRSQRCLRYSASFPYIPNIQVFPPLCRSAHLGSHSHCVCQWARLSRVHSGNDNHHLRHDHVLRREECSSNNVYQHSRCVLVHHRYHDHAWVSASVHHFYLAPRRGNYPSQTSTFPSPDMWHETLFDQLKASAYTCKKELSVAFKIRQNA